MLVGQPQTAGATKRRPRGREERFRGIPPECTRYQTTAEKMQRPVPRGASGSARKAGRSLSVASCSSPSQWRRLPRCGPRRRRPRVAGRSSAGARFASGCERRCPIDDPNQLSGEGGVRRRAAGAAIQSVTTTAVLAQGLRALLGVARSRDRPERSRVRFTGLRGGRVRSCRVLRRSRVLGGGALARAVGRGRREGR